MKIIYGGVTYTFPTYTGLTNLQFDVRNNEVKRAFTHGAVDNGDGKIDPRIVEIESYVEADTKSLYIAAMSAIKSAVYRRDYQLYLSDDRFINVTALDKWKEVTVKGFDNKGFATMAFRCCDPFFYALAATTASRSASTTPYQFTVNNPGDADTPLIISIAPAQAAADIRITNMSDGGRAFAYKDTLLVTPTETVINGVVGTVYRGSGNAINAFSGTFLKLLPGDNVLKYEGAAASITTQFIARYL